MVARSAIAANQPKASGLASARNGQRDLSYKFLNPQSDFFSARKLLISMTFARPRGAPVEFAAKKVYSRTKGHGSAVDAKDKSRRFR